jgi:2-methylcitrate dehydratase
MADQTRRILPADTNQALGIAEYAIEFMATGQPDASVLKRTNQFNTDAVICGISALALGTNAPTVLRNEALEYKAAKGVPVFGSREKVAPEKAIAANAAAVREWDSHGTNFGYSEERPEHRAGEFGHNDFYAVPIAAAQLAGKDGAHALRGMVLLDEIRGRLAEVFSLKTYKIDHVVHGAVASAATYGAMLGATAEQIESAIGMVIAHAIPFRAIRHGHQLSDSKGASAAISTEFAILCMKRSMAGFIGPKDIFRNPEAIFCLFTKTKGRAPFDLVLSRGGADFTVMGMHFKLGLYEHQSAGALQGLIDLLSKHPSLLSSRSQPGDRIRKMVVKAYEPAFHIIGDPAKRDPHTRQSADHSMLYLVCTMLRKAIELHAQHGEKQVGHRLGWKELMLTPHDFTKDAIFHPVTRSLMEKMTFEHGGPDYDRRYPDGIPTSMQITSDDGETYDSGLVMYPGGHARNKTADLQDILNHKWKTLGSLAVKEPAAIIERFGTLEKRSAAEVAGLYDFEILNRGRFE